MQGVYVKRLPHRFIIFFQIRKILHAITLLEKMSTKKNVSDKLASFQQVHTLQWKVWLEVVLTITKNSIEMASGYYLV